MRSDILTVRTGGTARVHDLSRDCAAFVAGAGDGLLTAIDDLLPRDGRWEHEHGSAGHGRDHVLPAFVAPSITVPVLEGRLTLGTWQSVCLVDTNVDNATREVRLSFLAG